MDVEITKRHETLESLRADYRFKIRKLDQLCNMDLAGRVGQDERFLKKKKITDDRVAVLSRSLQDELAKLKESFDERMKGCAHACICFSKHLHRK